MPAVFKRRHPAVFTHNNSRGLSSVALEGAVLSLTDKKKKKTDWYAIMNWISWIGKPSTNGASR